MENQQTDICSASQTLTNLRFKELSLGKDLFYKKFSPRLLLSPLQTLLWHQLLQSLDT